MFSHLGGSLITPRILPNQHFGGGQHAHSNEDGVPARLGMKANPVLFNIFGPLGLVHGDLEGIHRAPTQIVGP